MEMAFFSMFNIVGTAAFAIGVVLVLIELFKKGLSKLSLFAYICFILGIVLLSIGVVQAVLSIAVLSLLFLLLMYFYQKDMKSRENKSGDNE